MSVKNITNDQTFTSTVAHGIIPKNLPSRDLAFVYMLTKEMVVTRLTQHQVQLMQEMREQDSELIKMNKKLNKKVVIDPKYLTTKDAATYIGTDPSFLTKRQGKTFKLGKHFFKPEDESIVRWDILALEEWLTTQQKDTNIADDKLASLLKRR